MRRVSIVDTGSDSGSTAMLIRRLAVGAGGGRPPKLCLRLPAAPARGIASQVGEDRASGQTARSNTREFARESNRLCGPQGSMSRVTRATRSALAAVDANAVAAPAPASRAKRGAAAAPAAPELPAYLAELQADSARPAALACLRRRGRLAPALLELAAWAWPAAHPPRPAPQSTRAWQRCRPRRTRPWWPSGRSWPYSWPACRPR